MAGDEKNIGTVEAGPDTDPLFPVTGAVKDAKTATDAVRAFLAMENAQIIRLEAAASPVSQSQWPKLRVRYLILNANAIDISLRIGTILYPFTFVSGTGIEVVPFPIVIERGVDMAAVGANGRIYVVGDPE